jgi:pimeloyl-ACP methyl ester carboxylesterase
VNVPTTSSGARRSHQSPAYAAAFHRLIPGSTLTLIPDAGHLLHFERTGALVEAMQTFLRN